MSQDVVEGGFCACCGRPRRVWKRASADGPIAEVSRYCDRHERALAGFSETLSRLTDGAITEPAIFEAPLPEYAERVLRELACELCGGGSIARSVELHQIRAWILSLTNIPQADVARELSISKRAVSDAVRRVSDALQIAANDSGITVGTLRNVLVRALSEPSQRVGWMNNLGDEAPGNLEKALRSAITLRVQAGPSAARAILSLLLSPLAAVAPQLLEIPPLVWKFPSLPDAAFDVKRTLRSLEHWPSACDRARRDPEIRQVLDAWIESAREQFRRRASDDPNHAILGDLEQALCLLREALVGLAVPPVAAGSTFPRRCVCCAQQTIDAFQDYCQDHVPGGLLASDRRKVGDDLIRFTKTVREIESRMTDSGGVTPARDWIDYRKREAAEWEGVRRLAEDHHALLAKQQAAASRLGELTVKAERAQFDVPIGRIRRALYEFQRRKLDGGRLLLAVCAEIGSGNGPLPSRKQLAEQFGVTPQAIHKRLPAAQRDLLAAAQIAALSWEPASAPGDLNAQREDLHRCVLTAALVRWDWPSEPACEFTDSDVAQAAQGMASRSEKET